MPRADTYPPISDYALIGDCHSAALISLRGSIEWCCLPRFDAGSTFARVLDRERGGHCSITPLQDGEWSFTRHYVADSLVLETTIQGTGGELRVLDCLTIREEARGTPARQVLRVLEGNRGAVELELKVAPRFDYGQVRPWIRRHGHRLHSALGGDDALLVWCEEELHEDPAHELVATFAVRAGERVRLALTYCPPELVDAGPPAEPDAESLDRALEQTVRWWRDWVAQLRLGTRDEPGARQSGMVLKALTHEPTGAIVAAPTTSLP
ncbi:MAG: hypothetical protein JOZ64_14650, partial [Solirubrobacterales bacterium]|nr:hypothetical protein [Solirubrobacterales bacterium]